MIDSPSSTKVLVTGANGFIGLHTTLHLLHLGYRLRGTIRNETNKANVVKALPNQIDASQLEFAFVDLSRDECWNEAVQGWVNRDAYLDRIDGLVYGDDPRRGFREGEWFYHPGEAFQFRVPAQWQFKREVEQIQMSHPQELGIVLFLPANGTVDQVARDFVAQLKAQVLQSASQTLNGFKVLRLVSTVAYRDTQEKIDVVKQRLIKNHGYCEICSTDVLNFVASIFARGDAKD